MNAVIKYLLESLPTIAPLLPSIVVASGGLLIIALPREFGRWFGAGISSLFLVLGIAASATHLTINRSAIPANPDVSWDFLGLWFPGLSSLIGLLYLACLLRTIDRDANAVASMLVGAAGVSAMAVAGSISTLVLGAAAVCLGIAGICVFAVHSIRESEREAVRGMVFCFFLFAIWGIGLALITFGVGASELEVVSKTMSRRFAELTPITVVGIVFVLVGCAGAFGLTPFGTWMPSANSNSLGTAISIRGLFANSAALLVVRLFPDCSYDVFRLILVFVVATLVYLCVELLAVESIVRWLIASTIVNFSLIFLGFGLNQSALASNVVYSSILLLLTTTISFLALGLAIETCESKRIGEYARPQSVIRWCAIIAMATLSGVPLAAGFVPRVLLALSAKQSINGNYGTVVVLFAFLILLFVQSVAAIRAWRQWTDSPPDAAVDENSKWMTGAAAFATVLLLIFSVCPGAVISGLIRLIDGTGK